MSDKPAEARGRPFEPGDDPRRGHGPEKGTPNAGRPSKQYRERMRELVDRESVGAYLARCVRGDFGPKVAFRARKFAAAHAFGRAPETERHSGKGPLLLVGKLEDVETWEDGQERERGAGGRRVVVRYE